MGVGVGRNGMWGWGRDEIDVGRPERSSMQPKIKYNSGVGRPYSAAQIDGEIGM